MLNNVIAYDFYAPEPTMKFAGLDEFLPLFGGIKPNQWDEDAPDPNDVPND